MGVAALAALLAGVAALAAAVVVAGASPLLPALDRLSPRRRATLLEWIIAAPVVAMVIVPAICLLPSLLSLIWPALDHCTVHSHHHHRLHLCFVHQPVVTSTVAVGGFAVLGALVSSVVGAVGWRLARSTHSLAPLQRTVCAEFECCVGVVPTSRAVAFTAGLLSPRVYVGEGLARALPPEQWAVVVEHEREHARRRDPLRMLLLQGAAVLQLPFVRARLFEAYGLAVELRCDEAAVRASGGDRLLVAETLLALARIGGGRSPAAAVSIADSAAQLEQRVHALLADELPEARSSGWESYALVVALTACAAWPAHHFAEHLLGSWLA